MNFKQIYQQEKMKDEALKSHAKTWIEDIASITHKSEQTVRMWLSGRQKPDELTMVILEKYLEIPKEELFN